MHTQELFEYYVEFISICLKNYISAKDLIIDCTKRYTNNDISHEGVYFFLASFQKVIIPSEFDEKLKEYYYVENENIILTEKGAQLHSKLDSIMKIHAKMLRFNGIEISDVINNIGTLNKHHNFWIALLK